MLVFEERGKPEYPVKNLSEQRREPKTYTCMKVNIYFCILSTEG